MTLLPEMLLAGGGMKKLAEACRSRTDQRHQRCRSLVLKTRRVTGPHALPYFEGHRNAFGSRFALASAASPLALCSRCPALAPRSPNSVVNSPVAENLFRRVRQRFLGEVPVLHVEALAFGGRA